MNVGQLAGLRTAVQTALDRWRNDLRPAPRDPDLTRDELWEQHRARVLGPEHVPERTEFIRFIEDYLEFEHPSSLERAVGAAVFLAVGPELWDQLPSILQAIAAICGSLGQQADIDLSVVGRAPEFAIAYFLGWNGRSFQINSNGLDGVPLQVRFIVQQFLAESVDSCLNWLGRRVIGFPQSEDANKWAIRIFNLLISTRNGCTCFTRSASFTAMSGVSLNPETLRGNAGRKAHTCLNQHNIRVWAPWRKAVDGESGRVSASLWLYLQRAAKGFSGKFAPGQFPAGMFLDLWNVEAERYDPGLALRLVKAVVHTCPKCDKSTFLPRCVRCGRPLDDTAATIARSHLIIADPKSSGFTCKPAWACPCGHVYAARSCVRPCAGSQAEDAADATTHDRCPRCGELHPVITPGRRGKRPRPSTVYFFAGNSSADPGSSEAPDVVEPRAPQPSDVFEDAFEAARDLFAWRGWERKLVTLIEERIAGGKAGWIGFREPARVDWKALHAELAGAVGLPASHRGLETAFCQTMHAPLIAILRSHVEKAGVRWDMLERWLYENAGDEGEGGADVN